MSFCRLELLRVLQQRGLERHQAGARLALLQEPIDVLEAGDVLFSFEQAHDFL